VNNWASITELRVDGFSTANETCAKLPITGVTASGNDGDVPANVLDNNFNTRWSNLGIGSWIQADLGSNMNICSVDIAWYLGNTRQNNFVISVSNDGTTFTNVFSGKSSGTTLSFETYNLPEGTTGRYVRVTVNGNTVNNWASITELRVGGFSNPSPTPPTADNKTIQTNAGTPVTITLTGTDPIPGDVLKFSVVTLPQHGTVTTGTTSNSVTYTPNTGFSGTDSFTYKATDGQGVDSNIATVTITVNAPPPTANDESIQTNAGTPVTITLTGTDPIPGDVLKFSVVGNPQHGTITPGTVSSIVFYTPNSGFTGTDSFTYKATDGQGVDSNIATVAITVSSASSGTLDKFGIKELYPTKANGEQWYFNMQNPTSDPQLNPNGVTLTKNTDGSYKVQSSQVRLHVYTSSGYHQNLITTYNQQVLAQKGYMQSPNDWKNVEITGYMKVNHFTTSTTNGAAHIALSARGGTHSSTVPCEGTAYWSSTYETGTVQFKKELEHTAGYTTNNPEISGATGTLQGKWIGIKAVYYTFQNGSVQLEQWLDDKSDNINSPGNNWHRVLQFKDIGSWGGGTNGCGGTPTTIITWGGPITQFRWDNIDNMDIKDLSVRELQPPQ
jgi:F5/8 type C domain/Bacterial Ig domain